MIVFWKQGVLTCAICGSLLVQAGQIWECVNLSCEDSDANHPDIPVEQPRVFAGWNNNEQAASTASVYNPYGATKHFF